tara:strand:+ start:335 stop:523 length:189 start_codon:yes stop_codon:yes gene_type:complete
MDKEFEGSLDYVRHVIDNEGFDYGMVAMTDFSAVKDERFHKLRVAFLENRRRLCEYLSIPEI